MPRQQVTSKLKGISDIVFCIDLSGSMRPCIEGVKNHISTFVSNLEMGSPNMVIDWRMAFCGYNAENFYVSRFTDRTSDFSNMLRGVNVENRNEYTPGAIDYCVSQLPWRNECNKFLIVFTDERFKGGMEYSDTIANFPDLLREIEDSHTSLFFFGPKDKYYGQFEHLPRANTKFISGSFEGVDFSTLLSSLGKTVSRSTGGQGGYSTYSPRSVYDISDITIHNI